MGQNKKSAPRKTIQRKHASSKEEAPPKAVQTPARKAAAATRSASAKSLSKAASKATPDSLAKAASISPITDAPKPLGRKRDPERDRAILDAATDILSEIGFDAMTMDQVATRAGAGKATLYRRWPSKAELVRDALIGMSRNSIEVDHLPDTGSLRDDLLAVVKPHSMEYSERKIRVLAGLGSFCTQHQLLYNEALEGIFRPWAEINTALMQRAMVRKELPAHADVQTACEVIAAMTAYCVSTQRKHFDKSSYATLLDNILLPGLRGREQNLLYLAGVDP